MTPIRCFSDFPKATDMPDTENSFVLSGTPGCHPTLPATPEESGRWRELAQDTEGGGILNAGCMLTYDFYLEKPQNSKWRLERVQFKHVEIRDRKWTAAEETWNYLGKPDEAFPKGSEHLLNYMFIHQIHRASLEIQTQCWTLGIHR